MGADWNAMRPWHRGPLQLWSRFPAEVAPDVILSPLLFLTDRAARGDAGNACTLRPHGLLVMHARGAEHVDQLLAEVGPRLAHLPFAFVLDADERVLHPLGRVGLTLQLEQLPAILQQVVVGYAATEIVEGLEAFCDEQREAVARFPHREQAQAFRDLPEIQTRVAAAAARAEAAPLRLWEAMLWRGENYRWELWSGEVPLVGELWSPLAANRTVVQCVTDAERAFEARVDEVDGWLVCGPMRLRQRGSVSSCASVRHPPTFAPRSARAPASRATTACRACGARSWLEAITARPR